MDQGPRILMISSDRRILAKGSAVSERMKEYGKLVRELNIVLFSDRSHGLKETQLGENVRVFPTNSSIKYLRPFDAVRIGRGLHCNLITTQDPFECGWVGMKLKKIKRIPLEVQLHTDSFSSYFSGFLNFVRRLMAGRILRNADGIRVVTKYIADRLAEEFKVSISKIVVLPIYVDRSYLNVKEDIDFKQRLGWEQVLLSVCRLSSEKHLSLAIRALATVREDFPKAGYIIVGTGPEADKLKAITKSLGLEEAVYFAGWQDELGSFYKSADIYLQPSKYEGYGMSLVEAGLAGIAVISTPVGLAKELEPGLDLLIASGQHSFTKAIISLLKDDGKRRALGESLKLTLESELMTKEAYLAELKGNWEKLSRE